mmetsp:Transcript_26024/g.54291  ORF Transcript_26024/g.54291 Transcript_26024/m.54291 type:complete len:576 (-) Transcript_26024:196-1923(-)
MGGGGRLVDRPPSSKSSEAALKSGDAAMTELMQQRQRGGGGGRDDIIGRRGIVTDATTATTMAAGGNDDGLWMNRGANTSGPTRAAVAAAASSPHNSTLNNSLRNISRNTHRNRKNPEDEEDEWQGSDSKQSRCIFVGKSDDDNQNLRSRGYNNNPATMSKTDYDHEEKDYYDNRDDVSTTISQFIHHLRTKHKPSLDMVEMEGDGNCLFRAISLQVYGDSSMHLEVRRRCLDFMEREADHFHNFVADEDFGEYIARKRMEGVHGNHTEIQAMSELYNRSIEVFVPDNQHGLVEPINIFHSEYKGDDAPIRLCYMDGNHYNAIVDPLLPTAGLGLGLPGLQPGLADKLQLDEAKKISDDSAMEEKMRLALEESNRANKAREETEMKEAMRKSSRELKANTKTATIDSDDDVYKKKAMYLSEIEAADFDLEQAVLASSLESYQKIEQERKQPSSRHGEGRRSRFNSSPRSQRFSSNSPVRRASAAPLAASPASNQYAAAASSSAASLPSASTQVAAAASRTNYDTSSFAAPTDEYPASVQELTMNGFELSKVLHAYDLVGDNFDDMLSFLLSTATS